jgi:hypothetical protein
MIVDFCLSCVLLRARGAASVCLKEREDETMLDIEGGSRLSCSARLSALVEEEEEDSPAPVRARLFASDSVFSRCLHRVGLAG